MSDRRIHTAFDLPSDLGDARRLQEEIEEALQSCRYGERDIFSIRLALEEALVNAIKHGNQMDPTKRVSGHYTVTSERFDILIRDEGPGFDVGDVPDPTAPENLERPCGRGVHLIRHFMSSVDYVGKGNEIAMSKLRTPTDD